MERVENTFSTPKLESMRAIVRASGGPTLGSVDRRSPAPGWASIRVLLAGICRTDLYAARGDLPVEPGRILGHELVGELDGERVTVAPLVPCRRCEPCAGGRRCAAPEMLGVGLDGAFADWVCVPTANVHVVPRGMPLRRAALVEPVAASLAVLGAVGPRDGRGLVLGSGRIAALTARILRDAGVTVDESARDAAPASYDFVVETDASLLDRAVEAVRPGGRVVLKSRPARPASLSLARAVLNDVSFSAVSYGDFGAAVALAERLALDDLLGDVFPCERFAAAFERAGTADSAKIFLSFGEG